MFLVTIAGCPITSPFIVTDVCRMHPGTSPLDKVVMSGDQNNDDGNERTRRPTDGRRDDRRRGGENESYRDDDDWMRPSRPTVITVFEKLGFDVRDPDAVRELREIFKFVADQRRREEWWRNRRMGWIVLFGTTIAGSVFGTLANWFMGRR